MHTLGKPHCVIVPLGGDTGLFDLADLAAAGIDHLCVNIAAPTRTCVTVVDRAEGSATELVQEHDALTSADATALLDLLSSQLPSAKMLILSGSVGAGHWG